MNNGSTAECVVTGAAVVVEVERKGRVMVRRLKSIPLARVIVDTILLLSLLAAASSVLLQR
jgi:hypothetical protein